MTDTEYKLAEAEFFLNCMRTNYGKENKFNFYLSAFISAARSVHWIMNAEYHEVPGWQEWCRQTNENCTDDVRDILKRTAKMRNHALKQGAVRADIVTRFKLPKAEMERLKNAGPGCIKIEGSLNNPQVIIMNEETRETTVFPFVKIAEFGRHEPKFFRHKDVFKECEKYFRIMDLFVKECAEKFGRPTKGASGHEVDGELQC
jgi:hypothetical protein